MLRVASRPHGNGAGIRYATASQDADAYRAFHSQELRLGEPNPRGWTLQKIFRLDGPQFEEQETGLALPSASEICPSSSAGRMDSGSASDRHRETQRDTKRHGETQEEVEGADRV